MSYNKHTITVSSRPRVSYKHVSVSNDACSRLNTGHYKSWKYTVAVKNYLTVRVKNNSIIGNSNVVITKRSISIIVRLTNVLTLILDSKYLQLKIEISDKFRFSHYYLLLIIKNTYLLNILFFVLLPFKVIDFVLERNRQLEYI